MYNFGSYKLYVNISYNYIVNSISLYITYMANFASHVIHVWYFICLAWLCWACVSYMYLLPWIKLDWISLLFQAVTHVLHLYCYICIKIYSCITHVDIHTCNTYVGHTHVLHVSTVCIAGDLQIYLCITGVIKNYMCSTPSTSHMLYYLLYRHVIHIHIHGLCHTCNTHTHTWLVSQM